MSASVEEPKEISEPNEKLEVSTESGDQSADTSVNNDLVKQSKKGLFGRSAEFLKSPEPNAMEVVEANESNGNIVDEPLKDSSSFEGGKGDSTEEVVKKEEDEEKKDTPSLADELAACVAEKEEEKPESAVVTCKKTITITEETVEEVKNDDIEVADEEKAGKSDELEKNEEKGGEEDEVDDKPAVEQSEPNITADDSCLSESQEPVKNVIKKGRKVKHKVMQEETPMNERRRSLRTPKTTPVSTPAKSVTEKVTRKPLARNEKSAAETTTRSSARKKEEKLTESTPVKKTASSSKPNSAKKSRSSESEKKAKVEQNSDTNDPFNISNIDNHPVILSNIQIHSAQFGSMKFTKASPGTSHGRYEKTEQTAGERRSNLADMAPQTTPRKSLSELSSSTTTQRRESASKNKRRSSNKIAKEPVVDEGEPMESEEVLTPKSTKRNRTNVKTPNTAKKIETPSRKRKSSMSGTASAKQQKVEPEIPKLSADEQFAVDHRENEHMPYKIGARVYALWNREYYSAIITADFDAAGRYGVTFVQDNLFRKLVITGIIPLQAIVAGIKVYAMDPEVPEKDARLEEVEIISTPSEKDHQKWAEGIFKVKICENEKEFDVAWDKLCFGIDEAKLLQTAKFNNVTDVIADNIDSKEGRRTRASRHSFAPEMALSPGVSKPTPKKRNAPRREKQSEEPATVEIGLTEKQTKQAKTEAGDIFSNVSFVVTSAMRRMKEEEQGGFSKREIRQMIESCGGNVVEDFTKIPAGAQMFLIADTHYRTHKYLSALARSVPCVSHRWIRECVEQGELLDYEPYMLPAGVSLLTNKLTPWHQSNNTLLLGKCIYIYTRNMIPDASVPNFVQIWSPLVAQMGATVVNEIPKDGLDILLTDATCTEEIVQQARRCNALVVSSEWIIQAIIEGSLPDPNAHERFRYDFVEKPEGM